jgi:hypothetical protein
MMGIMDLIIADGQRRRSRLEIEGRAAGQIEALLWRLEQREVLDMDDGVQTAVRRAARDILDAYVSDGKIEAFRLRLAQLGYIVTRGQYKSPPANDRHESAA